MNNPHDQNILNVNSEKNPISNENFVDGNQNPTNPKKKKKRKVKHLERKNETEDDDGTFNIYKLGDVKLAEIHRSANRPLRKLKEPDGNCTFCPCCYLPAEKENYLVQFKTCDNPDDFSDHGQGIVLYFSFIKFCTIVLFIASIFICFFNIYYSFKYTKELLFTTEADDNEDKSKYARVDSIFFIFSAVNTKYYRNLYSEISTEKSNSFDSTVVNISKISFFCLLFTFVFNLAFIFFLFNKANAATYLSFTVSDYIIFLLLLVIILFFYIIYMMFMRSF